MTRDNLKAAFAGDAWAHLRGLAFGEVAEGENRPDRVRLFRPTASRPAGPRHSHFRQRGPVRAPLDNVQEAIDGGACGVAEMGAAYHAVAALPKEKGKVGSAHAPAAEQVHAGLFTRARKSALAEENAQVGKVHGCAVSGHTVAGKAPERRPICQAPRAKGNVS